MGKLSCAYISGGNYISIFHADNYFRNTVKVFHPDILDARIHPRHRFFESGQWMDWRSLSQLANLSAQCGGILLYSCKRNYDSQAGDPCEGRCRVLLNRRG